MKRKLRFYRTAIKWLWQHRAEPNNRAKWWRVIRENMTREDAMAFCRSCGWEMRENGVIYSLTMEGEAV